MKYFNKRTDEVLKLLNSDVDGLSDGEALNRLNIYGKNELEEKRGKSKLRLFLEQFNDMMIIILIIVALIMLIYGIFVSHDYTDTIVIFAVVLINAIMGYVQERNAEVTLDGLKHYSVTHTKVKRNGEVKIVESSTLVPGDIIILESGDKVPADARIIEESNLLVDESPLTGESVPVKKVKAVIKGEGKQIQDELNMLFSGSNITNGRCMAVVTSTGMLTELGKIAVSLNTPYEIKTPLQLKIQEISKKLTMLIFIILILIFIYGVIKGYETLEIVMLCVSLAVAAIPEGLPAVITITLSTGAASLAQKKAVVREMCAVETLGSTDVICSDKTGTITQNKMSVVDTKIYDDKMFKYVAILANDTIIENNSLIGDPTETCLISYFKDKGEDILKIQEKNIRLIDAPFDSERKMMSTVNKINSKKYILVKGSLESLLDVCKYINDDGKKVKLTKEKINIIKEQELKMSSSSLRVIGFAYKELKKVPDDSTKCLKEENDLIFIGMVGIIDPPRVGVKEAVEKCKKAGIRPIMITGDSLVTACEIAHNVGIIEDASEGVLGCEMDDLTDDELKTFVRLYNVYARVSPEHKERIVKALESNGKVVAMTGDGVNDAPAIKDAHVGVGMGITGTEVTKSVADIILLDDSFTTIVSSIEEGRRIFNNIRNNVVYSLSSNFSEIFTVLIGMITSNTILLPIHILFIDLITDSIPSICLSFERADENIMDNSPRGIDKPLFTPFINASIITSAIIETIFVVLSYFIALKYYTASVASTIALLSLVIQEILYSITCRNLKKYIYKQGILSNKELNKGLLILIVIELIFFATNIGNIISIETLELSLLLKVLLFNLLGFIIYEILKPILLKVFKD